MKRGTAPMPNKTRRVTVAAGQTPDEFPKFQHSLIALARRKAAEQSQKGSRQKNAAQLRKLSKVLAARKRVDPNSTSDEQLMRWWKEWFGGDGKGGNPGRVWHALDYHLVAIEDFLCFQSFLEVDDDMAFGAWPETQWHEAAVFRVLDELRLSLVEPRASAKGTHCDLDKMRLWNVVRHSKWPKSPCRAKAKAYLKRLRASVRTLPVEQIRRARRRVEDLLNARRSAMELLKRGPYQMPTEGPPVSSFKLFARRHAMGLITTDFFDGIPLSSFLRLPPNERREVMKCFDAKGGDRKRNHRAKPESAPPGYYKRLLAWLLDNWPVFLEHRWDWKNVFDASQAAGFKYHKTHTSLIKWFADAGPPQKLNPDRKAGHTKQEALFASHKHLLTLAPSAPPGAH